MVAYQVAYEIARVAGTDALLSALRRGGFVLRPKPGGISELIQVNGGRVPGPA